MAIVSRRAWRAWLPWLCLPVFVLVSSPIFWSFSLRLSLFLGLSFPVGSASCVFQPDLLAG